MAKIPRDVSLVRDGKPLQFWLRELVSEDSDRRSAAVAVIVAMHHALPSVHTNLRDVDRSHFDFNEHKRNLLEAMRNAIERPGFDTADFVRRLCALELACDREWQRHIEANRAIRRVRDAKFDRISKPLIDTINNPIDDEEKEEAIHRFALLCRAYVCGGREKRDSVSPSVSGGVARMLVLEALGGQIMSAPEAIDGLLQARNVRYKGLKALKDAGAAALPFAPKLLATIDSAQKSEEHAFRFAEEAAALASIGRGNAHVVDALIERLASPNGVIRSTAAQALKWMAPTVCGRESAIIAALLPLLDSEETSYEAVGALAAVGRDDPRIRRLIIDRARPAPARMFRPPNFPQYEYDLTMAQRGAAISAMANFTAYPDECLPVLMDAIDTFNEFDPDEEYAGPMARISRALKAFGPQAAAAAVPLAKHLQDGDDMPKAILDAFAAMGPAASDAIPLIEAYQLSRGGAVRDQDRDRVHQVLLEIRQ